MASLTLRRKARKIAPWAWGFAYVALLIANLYLEISGPGRVWAVALIAILGLLLLYVVIEEDSWWDKMYPMLLVALGVLNYLLIS